MSILFDKCLKSVCPGQIQELQCHQVFSRLAVAFFDGNAQKSSVIVFKEGVALSESVIRRSGLVKTLSWHPTQMLLAIGWRSGEITLQNMSDYSSHDVEADHKSNLAVMMWNCDGSHLLAGYSTAWLSLWKVNERGHVQQTASHHQKLDECPMMAVALASRVSGPASDLTLLARAAINGDVEALDFFSWKPASRSFRPEPTELDGFLVAGANGEVWHVNLNGQVTECFQTNEPIRKLLLNSQRNVLVTVTSSFMLMMHEIQGSGKLKETLKMKLTGDLASTDLVLAGRSTLAVATGKDNVRMFDVDTQDNYSLQMQRSTSEQPEKISCITYSEAKGLLAGGTDRGRICLWNHVPGPITCSNKSEPATSWHLLMASVVSQPIVSLQFGSSRSCLIASTSTDVFILEERRPCCICSQGTSVVQTGARQLSVDAYSMNSHFEIETDIQVRQLYSTKTHVAIFDGQSVMTYGLFSADERAESFSAPCSGICIYDRSIFTAHSGHIQVRNFQGVVKQLLKLPFPDDEILSMEVCGFFLVVGILSGIIVIYDLSRREVRRQCEPKCLRSVIHDFGHIVSAKCNTDASRVSIIVNKSDGSRDPRLYVWNAECDNVAYFNFFTGFSNLIECEEAVADSDFGLGSHQRLDVETSISGCIPVSHFWDSEEAKLLTCETNCIWDFDENWPPIATYASREDDACTATIFCGQDDNNLRIQNVFTNEKFCQQLVSLDFPFYYYAKKAGSSCPDVDENPRRNTPHLFSKISESSTTVRRVHENFVGLEKADDVTRVAMLNFTVSMTLGNLDEAFRAIASIKSQTVWENLAKTCVRNRRLDVARVCLAKMGNARAAKMLREAEKEAEVEAQLATLAIQLGLYEEAVELMRAAGRYDMLNNFYQSQGLWLQAISLAQTYDRLNLRTTYYNYAKYLESTGLRFEAIGYYEKSHTEGQEVPRMMISDLDFLKNYIHKSKDRTLLKWLGQYMEGVGQWEAACRCFEAAGDYLSLVRIYCCHLKDFAQALDLCRWSGDAGACWFLGRMYEQRGQHEEAIGLFMRARSYGRAIRIAIKQGYDEKLVYMALLGSREDMIEVARHLELKLTHVDSAVMLYHKAGLVSRAVDLALRSQSSVALQFISENLEETSDPHLMRNCAEFFLSTSQFDRAVSLLATAGRYDEAMRICQTKHVPMTEVLVEKLTPKDLGELDPARRNEVLEAIAEACMAQGEYRLAATKFNQAKNGLKSMKALIRHGDSDLIIQFAKVSRQRDVYIMAGNYLQSLEWQNDAKLIGHIVQFYNKAESFLSLAGFYEACAQVEITDYRNYEKAFQALDLSVRYLAKEDAPTEAAEVAVHERINDLEKRMSLINQFIVAKSKNDETSIEICRKLLELNCADAVCPADIYGYMVEYYAMNLCWNQAFGVLDEMRSALSGVNATNHISCSVLDAMEQSLSIPWDSSSSNRSTASALKMEERSEEKEKVTDDEDDDEELDTKCVA